MMFKRTDSITSSTSGSTRSDYSQPTENEQDDDDAPTIGSIHDSHVATPDKHPEASKMSYEKTQISPGSEAGTEKSVSVKLAELKAKVMDLFDEAEKALSEASLPDKDLRDRLKSTEDDRNYYRERKDKYKESQLVLERKLQKLENDFAVSQQKRIEAERAKMDMIEMGRRLFEA